MIWRNFFPYTLWVLDYTISCFHAIFYYIHTYYVKLICYMYIYEVRWFHEIFSHGTHHSLEITEFYCYIPIAICSKNSVKITFSLKNFTQNWFDEKNFALQWISRFSTLCGSNIAHNQKIFRQINSVSLVKTLLWRSFWQKCVRVNYVCTCTYIP